MESKSLSQSFPLGHDDFVHDVQFDFYGKRIATCSSDQKIKIWEKQPLNTNQSSNQQQQNGEQQPQQHQWTLVNEIGAAHQGAIWKVAWADPEFGQIIASCGYDKQVLIWREKEKSMQDHQRSWNRLGNQPVSDSVEDIKFAPKHFGLVLAAACANGEVKFFKATDLHNLNQWSEHYGEIKTGAAGCNCIAWNPAPDEPVMIVVGCSDPANKQNAIYDQQQQDLYEESLLQLYKLNGNDNKGQFEVFGQFKGHTQTINDIAWAPLAGRSFHLLVSCSTDKQILVWKLQVIDVMNMGANLETPNIQQLHKYQGQIATLRLKWNILGTSFAASSDDGIVRIWQRNYKEQFNEIASLKSK